MVRKELGHRKWKLSLRRTLFCPRKWTLGLSPVGRMWRLGLLTGVGEGVGWGKGDCVSESTVESYKNTGVQLGDFPTWRLPFKRSGVGH